MAGTPTWKGTTALFEGPESGIYAFDESRTYTQIRFGPYDACVSALVYRGTIGTGSLSTYGVKSCTVTKQKGGVGKMVTVWEQWSYGGGSVLPADEFALSPQDLNPSVEKNPYFATVCANDHALELARQAGLDVSDASKNAMVELLALGAGAGANGVALANMLRKGIQNYYQASFIYSYTQYFASLPSVSAGGFIGTPGGTLGGTIVALGLSCLRQADDLSYSNFVYKRTQSWICAANGAWESVLYP